MPGNRRSRSEKKPETQRLNAQIRKASFQLLMVHVVMKGQNPGDILSDRIDTHLKSWSMPADLTSRAKTTDRLEPTVQASLSVPTAA
jgi:hypothetical protein